MTPLTRDCFPNELSSQNSPRRIKCNRDCLLTVRWMHTLAGKMHYNWSSGKTCDWFLTSNQLTTHRPPHHQRNQTPAASHHLWLYFSFFSECHSRQFSPLMHFPLVLVRFMGAKLGLIRHGRSPGKLWMTIVQLGLWRSADDVEASNFFCLKSFCLSWKI